MNKLVELLAYGTEFNCGFLVGAVADEAVHLGCAALNQLVDPENLTTYLLAKTFFGTWALEAGSSLFGRVHSVTSLGFSMGTTTISIFQASRLPTLTCTNANHEYTTEANLAGYLAWALGYSYGGPVWGMFAGNCTAWSVSSLLHYCRYH